MIIILNKMHTGRRKVVTLDVELMYEFETNLL